MRPGAWSLRGGMRGGLLGGAPCCSAYVLACTALPALRCLHCCRPTYFEVVAADRIVPSLKAAAVYTLSVSTGPLTCCCCCMPCHAMAIPLQPLAHAAPARTPAGPVPAPLLAAPPAGLRGRGRGAAGGPAGLAQPAHGGRHVRGEPVRPVPAQDRGCRAVSRARAHQHTPAQAGPGRGGADGREAGQQARAPAPSCTKARCSSPRRSCCPTCAPRRTGCSGCTRGRASWGWRYGPARPEAPRRIRCGRQRPRPPCCANLWHPSRAPAPQPPTWRRTARRLLVRAFVAAYPWCHAAAEGSTLAYHMAYLLGSAPAHRPALHALGMQVSRVSAQDMVGVLSAAGAPEHKSGAPLAAHVCIYQETLGRTPCARSQGCRRPRTPHGKRSWRGCMRPASPQWCAARTRRCCAPPTLCPTTRATHSSLRCLRSRCAACCICSRAQCSPPSVLARKEGTSMHNANVCWPCRRP